jgi:hypothetical protein
LAIGNPDEEQQDQRKPIVDVQEAYAFNDIIEPLFKRRCGSCHGAQRQKGKLRLDQPDFILKGGKDGRVIQPGKAAASELVKRIKLPLEDDHHMAPHEKTQLTKSEIQLIEWWIDNGADFVRKVREMPQPHAIRPVLLALQQVPDNDTAKSDLPKGPVEPVSAAVLDSLKEMGVVILPVAQHSNYYQASYLNADWKRDSTLQWLLPLRKQLVWLKLSGTPFRDTGLAVVGQCLNLRRLQLDHTGVTDKGMRFLDSLQDLESLNLAGTAVTAGGLASLKHLRGLRSLFLYQTSVRKQDWPALMRDFPKTELDSGGYSVPFLATDTQVVKPPKRSAP